jgi:hypothetical protein
LDQLIPDDRKHIQPVLLEYAHVFHDEDSHEFKETKIVEHQILGDAAPIRRPPHRTPYALRQEMQIQVQKMLDKGVIRESTSLWSVPLKSANRYFPLFNIVTLPAYVTSGKFVQYQVDYEYFGLQHSQRGYVLLSEASFDLCKRGEITICSADIILRL